MTLVDSSVLLDVVTDGQAWADWSQDQLECAALNGLLVINDVIYRSFDALRQVRSGRRDACGIEHRGRAVATSGTLSGRESFSATSRR